MSYLILSPKYIELKHKSVGRNEHGNYTLCLDSTNGLSLEILDERLNMLDKVKSKPPKEKKLTKKQTIRAIAKYLESAPQDTIDAVLEVIPDAVGK